MKNLKLNRLKELEHEEEVRNLRESVNSWQVIIAVLAVGHIINVIIWIAHKIYSLI